MKKYIGTKEVQAEPMTAEVAVENGYKVNGHTGDGFEVTYKDGYKSWSPKDVFNEAYKLADTALDRMIIEGGQNQERFAKLKSFIESDKFKALDEATRAMLLTQVSVMKQYAYILNMRYTKMDSGNGGMCMFGFGIAIELLKNGFLVRRSGWNGKGMFIIKQVTAHIEEEIIPKMQSLPQSAKDKILECKGFIDYTSQCLIYNENTGRADSWVPSVSDVFAEDWELVL